MTAWLRCRALALCLFVWVAGCGEPEVVPATQILVRVTSEFGGIANVDAQVLDAAETMASDSAMFRVPADVVLPFTFAIKQPLVQAPRRAVDRILVVVTARDATGALMAQTKGYATFAAREKRVLELALLKDCIGKRCGAAQTCSRESLFECTAVPEMITVMEPDAGLQTGTSPVMPASDAGVILIPGSDAGATPIAIADAGGTRPSSEAGVVGGSTDAGARDAGPAEAGARDSGPPSDSATPLVDAGADAGPKATCCPSGDCLCRGAAPTALTSANGTFQTATLTLATGNAYYPTNATPPFAGIALCGGIGNTGPEMVQWGSFFASHGIVTVLTTTGASDLAPVRGMKLLAAINDLKQENTKSTSLLFGKMSDRYGIVGYSMGGGGATTAAAMTPSLKSVVGLAPWEPVGTGIVVPTLLLCGDADMVASCPMYTDPVYAQISEATPKMKVVVAGADHFPWFGPADAGGNGLPGQYALAFQKVFLEGDARWRPLLLSRPATGAMTTNIQ